MNSYEKYEKECKKIRKANERLLNEVEEWLNSFGLSEKTINAHHSNIDFYINEYLLYEDAIEAKEGVHNVDDFLGYWFIKKAMWASRSSIKSNATSLKKFYTFLHERDLVDKEDLTDLIKTIKEEMPEWLETLWGAMTILPLTIFGDIEPNGNRSHPSLFSALIPACSLREIRRWCRGM